METHQDIEGSYLETDYEFGIGNGQAPMVSKWPRPGLSIGYP